MEISVNNFSDLTTVELYAILALRSEVFVVEQNCVYQDVDGKDQKALHVCGYVDHQLVAYTRIFKGGDYFKNPSIGRVAVKAQYRAYGYGKAIMETSIDTIEKHFGACTIELSAQTYLLKFYKDLNFNQEGEGYLEDGIPHIRMIRN